MTPMFFRRSSGAPAEPGQSDSQPSPNVIALVSCVKKKRTQRCEAADLYTSTLFEKSRRYAERHADRWFILSAKYGLLAPDDHVDPYELTLKSMSASERRIWAQEVYSQMVDRALLAPGTSFVWLAGSAYQKDLSGLLADYEQRDPLHGLRMGERLQWLSRQG